MKDQLAHVRRGAGGARHRLVASAPRLMRTSAGLLLALAAVAAGVIVVTAQGGGGGQGQGDLHKHAGGNGQTATPQPSSTPVFTGVPQAPDATPGPGRTLAGEGHHAPLTGGGATPGTSGSGTTLPLTGGTGGTDAPTIPVTGSTRRAHPQATQKWPDIVLIPPAALPAAPSFRSVHGGFPVLPVALLGLGTLLLGGLLGLRMSRRKD
jgi:hypothetical protein